jgi:hypothetical protein
VTGPSCPTLAVDTFFVRGFPLRILGVAIPSFIRDSWDFPSGAIFAFAQSHNPVVSLPFAVNPFPTTSSTSQYVTTARHTQSHRYPSSCITLDRLNISVHARFIHLSLILTF